MKRQVLANNDDDDDDDDDGDGDRQEGTKEVEKGHGRTTREDEIYIYRRKV